MGILFRHPALDPLCERFLRVLAGRNRSPHTVAAYGTDLRQFFAWLHAQHPGVAAPEQVTRAQLHDYLAHLAARKLSGVSRARKLAALREFFRHLESEGGIAALPTAGLATPKKERTEPDVLTRAEYTRLLAAAGAHPRDFALFTVLLQTGIRVSELCALRLGDLDLAGRALKVQGKGQVERVVALERKGVQALKRWLAVRPPAGDDHVFLNRFGGPLGARGVKLLVQTYRARAGITKPVGAHGLRHTFATAKAEQHVSPYQLLAWLGHADLTTTMRYVHRAKRPDAQKVMEATSL